MTTPESHSALATPALTRQVQLCPDCGAPRIAAGYVHARGGDECQRRRKRDATAGPTIGAEVRQ